MKLTKWKKASNFAGADLSNYYVGLGRSRDSGLLTNSNFEVLLDRLGGESPIDSENPEAEQMVMVGHFSHWASGWVEQILVHESATDKLEILQAAAEEMDAYPVLDESHYSDAQSEYESDTFAIYAKDFVDEIVNFLDIENPKADTEQMLLCELAQALYGEACAYYGHEDAYVSDRTITTLIVQVSHSGSYSIEKNKYLQACLKKAQKVA